MLRFGETQANASWASIAWYATDVESLGADFRTLVKGRALPALDAERTPVVDQRFIEKSIVPTLVGYMFYPDGSGCDQGHRDSMSFSAPLHLFSLQGGLARSSRRWYRLGCPSAIAEDSLRRWDGNSGF